MSRGEICFTSSVSGYQESISDPSYAGQILIFAFPHIGNIGCNELDMESFKVHCSGVIIRENIANPANHRSKNSLADFLQKQQIPAIYGIDTRELIQIVRKSGPQNVVIAPIDYQVKKEDFVIKEDLFKKVTQEKNYRTKAENSGKNRKKVVLIDYGVKENIVRCVQERDVEVMQVPYYQSFEQIMSYNPDGFLLSNGPGDPEEIFAQTKDLIAKIINTKLPILGICLGHQLLGLHYGCQVKKLFQGHRGINHPVLNIQKNIVKISTQNHGFSIKKDSLSENLQLTYKSLLDDSVEGMKLRDDNHFVSSVQFHPESCPGTHDMREIFDEFCEKL